MGSFILTATIQAIVRPEIPVGQDILQVAWMYVCLIGAAGAFVWGIWNGPTIGLVKLAQYGLGIGMGVFAIVLVFRTARLFWKIDYLRRNPDEDG